ncbi:putative TetR family transcriptional regulator [Caenibius tardaugens NBRC 16725]|uniref:Putative TetR family transcriptional regulator n=1 Tax=Caenibius tardaugens NBRC 16725 TaxID=1219035 RepID=U2ZVA4_9SPHN|nr:TetR/AcrR family transcriptional regulator [Caenibius tardaugens]AZI36644.1 TetR/AcrR family transcriptional regulator [Caenibius tardaugens NBRC 16725]GAD49299.1 putative TetR family transcriptional regulator [Caenibius tardaugens NBRC 16725]
MALLARGEKRERDDGPGQRARGRPRNPANDAAILAAASDILAAQGFDALTFEAVAQAAGVSRVSIYRRWPSKAHLVTAIATRGDQQFPDVIEEEGLEGEILAVLRQLYDRYSQKAIGAASIGALVAWQRDPALRGELEAGLERDARTAFRQTIDKGKAQGMVRHAVDSDALFDIAVGAIIYGKLFSSLPARTIDIEHIVDIVVRGAEVR